MKYDLRRTETRTSSSAVLTYSDSFTVVKLPWWKRLWRWFK
jgi:hypothetical protein